MNKILVTGGAGYIGSNTVNLLIENSKNNEVFIIDNLSTGNKNLINPKAKFFNVDLCDFNSVQKVFKNILPDIIFHFAGLSQVSESNIFPDKYIKNNIDGGLNLLKSMVDSGCKKIIFSSSAAVYGKANKIPITENHELNPISIYGTTKKIFEEFLKLYDQSFGIKHLSLRYFNAGGASQNNLYGEMHDPETHLIPNVLKAAKENTIFNIYGDDYKTEDGTCIRDYIHVIDIANAHILGMKYLSNSNSKSQTINLGTNKGASIKNIISICEKVTNKNLNLNISNRRIGDPAILIASNSQAKEILNWEPKYEIKDIIESAWMFENSN